MEKLVSNLSNVKALPKDYIFPVEQRPGEALNAPVCTSIPVIDLAKAGLGRADVIQQILSASHEFGFFQVINHGVPANLMKETMSVVDEFFSMSDEDKASLYSEDATKSCRLFTSSRTNCAAEKGLLWRDNLRHHCHPLEAFIHLWPEKPARYRDVVGKYSVEVRSLSMKLLEMIREGLGLEPDFFEGGIADEQLLSINRYPPCPEPSLSLGLAKHADPNVITLLLQGLVIGLQVFKDGHWIGVEPLPNAFVVNIGYQLQIISNGRFKSSEHRAVTNSKETRTTIVSFISPSGNCIVEPAKALINEVNPLLYKAYHYQDFVNSYNHKFGSTENVLKGFMFD